MHTAAAVQQPSERRDNGNWLGVLAAHRKPASMKGDSSQDRVPGAGCLQHSAAAMQDFREAE